MPPTNIYDSIKYQWSIHSALENLVSSSRIRVGQAGDMETPYVVIEAPDEAFLEGTSKGKFWEETIRLSIYHEGYAAARAVQKAWRARLEAEDMTFTLDDGTFVRLSRMDTERAIEDGGIVRMTDIYTLLKQTSRYQK